jgi:AraC-like DNA-binding protein
MVCMPHATDARHGVLGLPPLLAVAKERGLDADALLREVGVAPTLLDDPTATIPVERVHALVHLLLDRTGDPTLGLDAAKHYHPTTFGLLGAVTAIAPTVREVIRLFVEYVHLTFTFFLLEFDEGDNDRLVFVDDGDLGPLHRFYLDRELAFVTEIGRALWPDSYVKIGRAAEFDYPEPAEAQRYREFFPCPVRFGATHSAFLFDLSGDQPARDANPLGFHVLKEHLSSFAGPSRPERGLAERVRRQLTLCLATRQTLPDLDVVARELGMSERALRRHLTTEGASFRALADGVIAQSAKRYLRDSERSISEIAERLGYSEPASFVRAFRRWTGTTPAAFRTAKPR